MKYLLLLLSGILLLNLTLSAQSDSQADQKKSILNKKGIKIGPEKGDIALGIDASPFLDYLGNLFKISDQNNPAPTFGFTAQAPGMIYFKYMQSETKAISFALRVGFSRNTDKDGTSHNNANIDKYISSATNLGLTFSMERSPFMKSRLRGYYGWGASVGLTPYYGESFAYPSTFITGKFNYVDGTSNIVNYVEKGGNTISIGGGGLIGVEYFVTPKISLSGQFNIALGYAYQLKRFHSTESGTETVIDPGESLIILDNIASGSLKLLCYF